MPDTFAPTQRLDPSGAAAPEATRIWDLPTRLFHWLLAMAVLGMIGTGIAGVMEWHFRIGYVVLALLLFRLIWGLVGGRWSRFSAFVYAPSSVWSYLKGRPHPDHLIGHTPLGSLSVLGLLGILIAQVATGLVADDEISSAGPLTRFVSGDLVGSATGWHTGIGKWIVIGLVVLHIVAVAYHVVHRRVSLVRPMITGDKHLSRHDISPSRDDGASRVVALVLFCACGGLAFWVASLRV